MKQSSARDFGYQISVMLAFVGSIKAMLCAFNDDWDRATLFMGGSSLLMFLMDWCRERERKKRPPTV